MGHHLLSNQKSQKTRGILGTQKDLRRQLVFEKARNNPLAKRPRTIHLVLFQKLNCSLLDPQLF